MRFSFLKGTISCVVFVLTWQVSTAPVSAEDQRYYGAFKLIGSFADMDGVSQTGFTNQIQERNTSDIVGGFGASIGYRWKNIPVHSEIEVSHRTRFDFDTRDDDPAFLNTVGYETNVATTSVLFSAALDWRNDSDFTPYAGGLIGWSRNSAETERNAGASARDQDTDNFAWGLIAGVIWDWDERWGMDLGYRYVDLGQVETGTFSTGESIQAEDYTTHDLLLSVFYRF